MLLMERLKTRLDEDIVSMLYEAKSGMLLICHRKYSNGGVCLVHHEHVVRINSAFRRRKDPPDAY